MVHGTAGLAPLLRRPGPMVPEADPRSLYRHDTNIPPRDRRHSPVTLPREGFYAQPPPPGVERRDWARAFLQAQSSDPQLRARGRETLTAMGCKWVDSATPPESEPPTEPHDIATGASQAQQAS